MGVKGVRLLCAFFFWYDLDALLHRIASGKMNKNSSAMRGKKVSVRCKCRVTKEVKCKIDLQLPYTARVQYVVMGYEIEFDTNDIIRINE